MTEFIETLVDVHESCRNEANGLRGQIEAQRITINRMDTIARQNAAALKTYLIEAASNLDITTDIATEIAAIFGIELQTEVEVNFTITGTMTVKVPIGEDVDDFMCDLEGTFHVEHDTEEIESFDVECRKSQW